MSNTTSGLARLGERCPPVLVREVRQALRGRVFRIAFLLVSTGGLVAAAAIAAAGSASLRPSEEIGRSLFDFVLVALFVTCLVQVPFGAFQSLASEWDEDTYDLLAMTNLRPRRIVFGKLVGALLQSCLHVCALTPVVVMCFLMRGVGLLQIALLLGSIALLCFAYSSVAIALASLTRLRLLRGLLQAAFALAAVFTSVALYEEIGQSLLRRTMRSSELWLTGGFLAVACIATVALGVEIASARLAHPEENRSTGLRVVVALSMFAGFAWLFGAMLNFGFDYEPLTYGTMGLSAFGALLSSSFVTERDPLGRRARLEVPASALRARVSTPLLPGGARGLLFVAFGFAAAFAFHVSLYFTHASSIGGNAWKATKLLVCGPFGLVLGPVLRLEQVQDKHTGPFALLVWLSWLWLVLVAARAVARFIPASLRGVSILVPFLVALLVVAAPIFFGLAIGDDDLQDGEHIGNPAWLVAGIDDGNRFALACASIVVLAAGASFALLLPSLRAAIHEIRSASAQNRARAAEPPQPIAEAMRSDARAAS